LRDAGPPEKLPAETLEDQLKAWFDLLLRAPVPPYLLRRVDELQRPREDDAP